MAVELRAPIDLTGKLGFHRWECKKGDKMEEGKEWDAKVVEKTGGGGWFGVFYGGGGVGKVNEKRVLREKETIGSGSGEGLS